MSLVTILEENKKICSEIGSSEVEVTVISNWSSEIYKEYILNAFLVSGINPKIKFIFTDFTENYLTKFSINQIVLVLNDIGYLVADLHIRQASLSQIEINQVIERGYKLIDAISDASSRCKLLITNNFSSTLYSENIFEDQMPIDEIANKLNDHIRSKELMYVDIKKIVENLGISQAKNYRDIYSKMVPYSPSMIEEIRKSIETKIAKTNGKLIKTIILDCDNTLWSGVIGEDLIDGLRFRPKDRMHSAYSEFHHLLKYLKSKGILLALSTKNNAPDIDEILKDPDFIFDEHDFVSIKANWVEKYINIIEISQELNLGLDSFLFIDDNPNEIASVQTFLPQVATIKVDKNFNKFISQFKKELNAILPISTTTKINATERYLVETKRNQVKNDLSWEDYLATLNVKISYSLSPSIDYERCSEMTRKTNQFNFTTNRRTKAELINFAADAELDLMQIEVSDSFGDYGITGFMEIKSERKIKTVEQFLLSCRVLGRGVERKIIDYLINEFLDDSDESLIIKYRPSAKNVILGEFIRGLCSCDFDPKRQQKIIYHRKENRWTLKPE